MLFQLGKRGNSSDQRFFIDTVRNSNKTLVSSLIYHAIDFRSHSATKGGVEDSLGQVDNLFWDAFPEEEGREVIGEVVTVVSKDIIGLQRG